MAARSALLRANLQPLWVKLPYQILSISLIIAGQKFSEPSTPDGQHKHKTNIIYHRRHNATGPAPRRRHDHIGLGQVTAQHK